MNVWLLLKRRHRALRDYDQLLMAKPLAVSTKFRNPTSLHTTAYLQQAMVLIGDDLTGGAHELNTHIRIYCCRACSRTGTRSFCCEVCCFETVTMTVILARPSAYFDTIPASSAYSMPQTALCTNASASELTPAAFSSRSSSR